MSRACALLIGVLALTSGCKRLIEGECGRYEARARGPLREAHEAVLEVSRLLPASAVDSGAELAAGLAKRISAQLAVLDKLEVKGEELGHAGADLRENLAAVQAGLSEVSTAYREVALDRASAAAGARLKRALERLTVDFTAYAQSGRRLEGVCAR